VLKVISVEVFESMQELLLYFMDCVWQFFSSDCTKYGQNVLSPKARFALTKIAKIRDPAADDFNSTKPGAKEESSLGVPDLTDDVQLDSESSLFGLAARVTGMESLTFLATVLRSLKPRLGQRLPGSQGRFILAFFSEIVDVVPELRWFVYKNISARLFDKRLAAMTKKMSSTKWDAKEILSQHNKYIDELVKDLNILSTRIDGLGASRLPSVAYQTIWAEVLQQINAEFLNG